MEKWIFKILRPKEWQAALATSAFAGAPVDVSDGYIHFSTRAQLGGTAAKHFTDTDNVHILAFASDSWPEDLLKWEVSRGGALFPHLYAPLDAGHRAADWTLARQKGSAFDLTPIDDWMKAHA